MEIKLQIKELIESQPEPKQSEMQELHNLILQLIPKCKQWYFDGNALSFSIRLNGFPCHLFQIKCKLI